MGPTGLGVRYAGRNWSLCWNTGPELSDQLRFQQKPEICMLATNEKLLENIIWAKQNILGMTTSPTGFLNLSTTDILDQISLCWV